METEETAVPVDRHAAPAAPRFGMELEQYQRLIEEVAVSNCRADLIPHTSYARTPCPLHLRSANNVVPLVLQEVQRAGYVLIKKYGINVLPDILLDLEPKPESTPVVLHVEQAGELHMWPLMPTRPMRGDEVERWLREQRNAYDNESAAWQALDDSLDAYRLAADTGQPLPRPPMEVWAVVNGGYYPSEVWALYETEEAAQKHVAANPGLGYEVTTFSVALEFPEDEDPPTRPATSSGT